MTILHALFLGLLQGLTEFLPVSSSGHLVLAEHMLNIHIAPQDMQGINILLHAGTLLALLLVYSEMWIKLLTSPLTKEKKHAQQLTLLMIATIPGALAGFFLEGWIAQHFQLLIFVGLAFAMTGLILIVGECCNGQHQTVWHRLLHPFADEPRKLTTRSALFIGIAQAFALVPGLSRSGLTISAGRMIGLERQEALDFSFLMAIPIIAGASAMTAVDFFMGNLEFPSTGIMSVAIITSFLSSLGAILFLRKFVVSRSLAWFAPYLFVVSGVTIILSLQ